MYKMLLAAAAIFALTLHARADEPMQAVEAVGAGCAAQPHGTM
jgi:hypothetical protein